MTMEQWTRINKPVNCSLVEWLERRYSHAAACVSGRLLVIVGRRSDRGRTVSDCWIHDFTTRIWNKVNII